MKRVLAMLIGLGVTISGASVTRAQPMAGAPEQKPTDKNPTAGRRDDARSTARTAVGTVKSTVADAIVVAGTSKEIEWTFAVGMATKVRRDGKGVNPAELRPGDQVRVRYMEHAGRSVAQDIAVTTAVKARAAPPASGKK